MQANEVPGCAPLPGQNIKKIHGDYWQLTYFFRMAAGQSCTPGLRRTRSLGSASWPQWQPWKFSVLASPFTSSPGGSLIKLFTAVTYDFS
jgi:hypothetical protein